MKVFIDLTKEDVEPCKKVKVQEEDLHSSNLTDVLYIPELLNRVCELSCIYNYHRNVKFSSSPRILLRLRAVNKDLNRIVSKYNKSRCGHPMSVWNLYAPDPDSIVCKRCKACVLCRRCSDKEMAYVMRKGFHYMRSKCISQLLRDGLKNEDVREEYTDLMEYMGPDSQCSEYEGEGDYLEEPEYMLKGNVKHWVKQVVLSIVDRGCDSGFTPVWEGESLEEYHDVFEIFGHRALFRCNACDRGRSSPSQLPIDEATCGDKPSAKLGVTNIRDFAQVPYY